jgi:hypothetical protein
VSRRALALTLGLALALPGCGLEVQLQDLFLLTRTGQGTTLRLVVNDSGTIRCNGGPTRTLSSAQLIQARVLADGLATDATKHLTIARAPDTVFYYRIKLQQGTVAFPDHAAGTHETLAQAELFAAQAAQKPCHLAG